jgi:hypothetical protein
VPARRLALAAGQRSALPTIELEAARREPIRFPRIIPAPAAEAPAREGLAMTANAYDTGYRIPKRVRLTVACIYLDTYYKNDDQGVIRKAVEMLDAANIELALWPDNGQKFAFNTLSYGAPVPHDSAAYKALRADVDQKIRRAGCPFVLPLPVVFCQYQSRGYGITPFAMKTITHACLISPVVNQDLVTMVHEIGHAAGLDHEEGDLNKGNFMHEADPRSNMYRYQVEALARAAFAVG